MTPPPENPLLAESGLPRFDAITAAHVLPAVKQLIAQCGDLLAEVERGATPTFESIFGPLDEIGRRWERTWGPVAHLFGVKNSPELREAYEAALPEIVEFGLRVRQSEPIYKALKTLRDGPEWTRLAPAQQRIVTQRVRSAELAGIGLSGPARERFNDIARELSQLSTQFSNHVLDATKQYALVLTDPADAEGLPLSLRSLAAQSYNAHKQADDPPATPDAGPWRITLDLPSCVPFLQHCRRRDLRAEMYRAFVTRASAGELDNTEICRRILALRREHARLLGYENFAQVSLAEKMAPSPQAVLEMLERLRQAAWGPAHQEMQELHELAIAAGQTEPIEHWDVPFWAERLRERRFQFTEEDLRPYFPHERVLAGLFSLAERLFGIRVMPAPDAAGLWHPDVRLFHVSDESGRPLASFTYDPYSRPENKRGGAWMDDCLARRPRPDAPGEFQLPVAHLVCNCTPPIGEKPSLMTFREVETLFHEFGHGLQHMLTTVDFPDAAGISGIEWDAVELPSQFLENWCYHRPVVLGMTAHVETGEPLPEELFEKLRAARTFRAGSNFLRQIMLGLTDLRLHTDFDPDGPQTIFDVQREVMTSTSVLPMFPQDRFLCSFTHVFAGGYAAGYYSYKWAEVLSADAFAAFEEAGLEDEAALRRLGRRFRETVLALGGSRHPLEVFTAFRGREPSPEPLLRHNGLLASAPAAPGASP